ncbi:MAG TPA: hypothetical protein VGH91_04745 [Gammaproteobacteria bacterium]|jgi:hypothetical protein
MGLHSDTEIYQTGYKLFDVVDVIAVNMRRPYNRRYGTKLQDEHFEAMSLIFDVNTETDHKVRVEHLRQIQKHVSRMETILRFVKDKGLCAPSHHKQAIPLLVSMGKQATAWKNSEQAKITKPAS